MYRDMPIGHVVGVGNYKDIMNTRENKEQLRN